MPPPPDHRHQWRFLFPGRNARAAGHHRRVDGCLDSIRCTVFCNYRAKTTPVRAARRPRGHPPQSGHQPDSTAAAPAGTSRPAGDDAGRGAARVAVMPQAAARIG
ncbi:MAG: hypothetical protein ACM3KE_20425 [Hyphomicrobiales bacterium]